jgi:hypothetical protein
VELLEAIGGGLLQKLGYELRFDHARIRRRYVLALKLQRAVGLARQAGHSLRTRGSFLPGWLRRKLKLGLYGDLLRVND